VVFNEVEKLTLTDFDTIWLADYKRLDIYRGSKTDYLIHNFIDSPLENSYDGIYGLDVLEHIDPINQSIFLSNVCVSLAPHGVAIFGMPSIESQIYASVGSKVGHVNCQSGEELKSNCEKHFENVFIFSMSDEVVHTGFMPMSHYLLALCVGPKKEALPK
jgi:2-polyprenyl-3-methyl-5-hydroxy-6-metoxy-1,4-benzoquinol methylase